MPTTFASPETMSAPAHDWIWGNPDGISLLALLREDYRANGSDVTDLGFRAIAVHRFGNWRMSITHGALRKPLSVLYRMSYRYVRNHYGIDLPCGTRVGRRLAIDHHGGIVVSGDAVIGDDCRLRHTTTIGIRSLHEEGAPTIRSGVDIGAGAALLGPIEVGEDAVIGANAVVLVDVPPGATAIGVPARIRPRRDATARAGAIDVGNTR
jgi:serine O-acetyltransferase